MTERFKFLEAVRDAGGTHDCRRRGCGGFLFHLYSDDMDWVKGLCCSACDYVRYLTTPIPSPE